MALHRLKTLTVGVVATLILSWAGPVPASDRDVPALPSRAEPLRVDSINKRVLIYTEVNPKSLNQSNPHWGVVFQGGKLNDKAILQAFCTPQEFHDALLQIGARPGNNLTLRSSGEVIGGDELLVSVTVARPFPAPGVGRYPGRFLRQGLPDPFRRQPATGRGRADRLHHLPGELPHRDHQQRRLSGHQHLQKDDIAQLPI